MALILAILTSLAASVSSAPGVHQAMTTQPPEPMTSRQINEALLLMEDNRGDIRRLMRRYEDLQFRDVHVTMNMTIDQRRRAGFLCGYVRGKDATGAYSEWIQFYARHGTVALATANRRVLDATCNSTVMQDPVDRSSLFSPDA